MTLLYVAFCRRQAFPPPHALFLCNRNSFEPVVSRFLSPLQEQDALQSADLMEENVTTILTETTHHIYNSYFVREFNSSQLYVLLRTAHEGYFPKDSTTTVASIFVCHPCNLGRPHHSAVLSIYSLLFICARVIRPQD